jgi:hypothetical protein
VTITKEEERKLRKTGLDSLLRMILKMEEMIKKYKERGQLIFSDRHPPSTENDVLVFKGLQK